MLRNKLAVWTCDSVLLYQQLGLLRLVHGMTERKLESLLSTVEIIMNIIKYCL